MSTRNYCTYAGIVMLLAALPLQAEQSEKYPFYGGFALGFASADSNCDYSGYCALVPSIFNNSRM